ncbi:MAG: ABC transporter permease [Thermodesulfovibrionales bacterium]|nr:ABC transporter permease [Thermodesulfovibrionales bacterium]
MKLSRISLGNLRRRKGKTLLLAAGLTIGVAMVVAMTGITHRMKADVERKLDEYGANIVITPKTESLSLSYGGVGVTDASYDTEELKEADAALIKTIENKQNISAIAPKVMGTYKISERSYLIVGVDFPSEFRIKKWWRLKNGKGDSHGTAPLPPSIPSPDEIILGTSAAAALSAASGGRLTLGGKEYTVAGVLEENASQDDIAVFMDINEAQRLLGKEGSLSMIEVSALCAACPIEDIVAQIGERLPHAKVSAVRQAMTLRMQTVGQVIRFSIAVSAVVLVIGFLIVFVSMTSSVNERTKEIGVLRAIGFRKSHIIKVILMEAFAVSLASGIAGWVAGSLSVGLLAPQFTGAKGFMFEPVMMALATALALFVGMLSSIYPAVKASRLEPLEALKYI